jgi:hypothetical protein
MTGLASDVSFLDREVLFPGLVVAEDLHLEAFRGFLEHAGRAFTLLQNALDGRRAADHRAHLGAQLHADFVDRLQIARIGDDDEQRLPVAPVRHEAVAQHQIGRDAPEERVVDVELLEIDELELVAAREPPRLLILRGPIRPPASRTGQRRARRCGGPGLSWSCINLGNQLVSVDSRKSGMYKDSSNPAMTAPIRISRMG